MAIRTLLWAFLFFGSLAAALVNPLFGALAYILVYLITPNARWWGMPLAEMGIRFSMLAGLFTIVGLFTAPHRVPKIRPWLCTWEAAAVALVLIAALNTYLIGKTPDPASHEAFTKFWKTMLFALILGRLASTRTNAKLVLWVLVAGSLYLGYDAWFAPIDRYAYAARLSLIGGPDFASSSGFAVHMTAMLPLIGSAFLLARRWRYKLLAMVSFALTANAIVLCRTRSAFVGLAAGMVVALLAIPRVRRFRILALLIIGGALSFTIADVNYWNRIRTMSTPDVATEDLAAKTRLEIWQASVRIIEDFPLGIGSGNFGRVIGEYDQRHPRRSSHNTVVTCFVELGLIGGAIFLFMVFMSLWALRQIARLAPWSRNPAETRYLAYGSLIAIVIYFVGGLGTDRFYVESMWWVLAMPIWLERCVRSEVRESGTELSLEPCCSVLDDLAPGERGPGDELEKADCSPRPALS